MRIGEAGLFLFAVLLFGSLILTFYVVQRAKTHWKCPKCGNRGPHIVEKSTVTHFDYYGWDDLKPPSAKATGNTRGGGKNREAEYEYQQEFEVSKCRFCGTSKPDF